MPSILLSFCTSSTLVALSRNLPVPVSDRRAEKRPPNDVIRSDVEEADRRTATGTTTKSYP
jgi:hypothetical protein